MSYKATKFPNGNSSVSQCFCGFVGGLEKYNHYGWYFPKLTHFSPRATSLFKDEFDAQTKFGVIEEKLGGNTNFEFFSSFASFPLHFIALTR